jgi:YD repeat-containing protein
MKRTLLPALLIAGLLPACRDRADQDAAPQSTCRIQTIEAGTTSSVYNATERTAYTYDGSGNLTRREVTSQLRYVDPQIARLANTDGTITDENTYDAQGYLLTALSRTVFRGVDASGRPTTDETTITTRYFYENNRVSSYTKEYRVSPSGGTPTTTTNTGAYTYDGAGKLTRRTETVSPGNVQYTWVYDGGKLVDYIQKTGSTEVHPIQFQNGRIARYSLPGWSATFEYDAGGRPTKMEERPNDRLDRYSTYAWTPGKPATSAVPPLKGFPVLDDGLVNAPAVDPADGRGSVLANQKDYYINPQSGATQFFSETTYAHQTNGAGFVTRTEKTTNYQNPSTLPQSVKTVTTYSYAGCE